MKQFWPKWTLLNVLVGFLCLTVIAVILAPVRMCCASPVTVCMSNIKQIGTAQLIYASDNDENLPPHYTFEREERELIASLTPYLKSPGILNCPESAKAKAPESEMPSTTTYEHFPLVLRFAQSNGIINLGKVLDPTKSPWMHDQILKVEKIPQGEHIETNHKSRDNRLVSVFLDGHARMHPTIPGERIPQISTDGLLAK